MTPGGLPVPDSAALQRIARRVGIFHIRAANAKRDYEGVQHAAQEAFAQIRRRGTPQQEITLPDGRKVGLISIETGATTVTVDEATLLLVAAVNDPADIEDYIDPVAMSDPAVLGLLREHMPHLVKRRITREARAGYDKEMAENDGRVFSRLTGERETVAQLTKLEATGKYSVRWNDKGTILLQEALDAGHIGLDGDLTEASSPLAPAAQEPDSPPRSDEPAAAPPAGPAAPQAPLPAADDEDARIERALARTTRTRHAAGPQHPPTGEQQAILDAFATGGNIAIKARAGTGKTTTLKFIGAAAPGRHGLYLAYNKAIVTDAKTGFGPDVTVSTAHSLAYQTLGKRYADRLHGARVPAAKAARILRINEPVRVDSDHLLAPAQLARLTMETVARFCHSADPELGAGHVPAKPGLDTPEAMAILRTAITPWARRAWDDLTGTTGELRFDHDTYLKLWQLSGPRLDADYLLVDECQDADPVILSVVQAQADAQIVAVGDDCQQIYEWRGAVNAMEKFGAARQLALSQSFRFGRAIASEANKWLDILAADPKITGSEKIGSAITTLPKPAAILCRTNGEAIAQVMQQVGASRRVALVGGGADVRALAQAASDLKNGKPTSHPELYAFATWGQVQDHAENDPGGADLKVLVRLIDDHGPETIIGIIDQLADERNADVVVSTAHKAKGREWDSVRIAADFRPPNGDRSDPGGDTVPAADARIAYVAVTRAKLNLDRTGLAWVDRYLPGGRS